MTPWLSIIIPVRKEPPAHLWFTLQSLAFEHLEGVEILVVDNTEKMDDEISRITSSFGAPVKYISAPAIQSPYHPRNIGAAAAKGEWLLFLDAHVLLRPGAINAIFGMSLAPRFQGEQCYPPMSMIHFPVGFRNQKTWYGHYRLTLDEDFWGKWGPTAVLGGPTSRIGTTPIRKIGASGIWSFLTRKKDWEAVGGFNQNFSGYGGGEVYIHLKYWRMGGQVLLDPAIWGVHYSAPRGYTAAWNERIRNVGIAGTAVVGPDFVKRFSPGLLTYFGSHGGNSFQHLGLLNAGRELGMQEWETLNKVCPLSFDEVLAKWAEEGVLTA